MALTRKYTWLTERTGPETTAGVIVWVCPEAEAEGQAVGLYNSTMPGSGGEYPARAKSVKAHHNAEPGFAWVVCRYITARQPGEARLVGGTRTEARAMKMDLDGAIVEGPAGDAVHWYKVWTGPNNLPGTNIIPHGIETITLKTAVEELDLPAIRANHGAVNDGRLPNFGNAPPGSLLFWDFSYKWQFGENLWYLDYEFWVCPYHDDAGNVLSWNETLYSRKSVWIVKEVPIYTPDASLPSDQWIATGEMARVKELVPGFEYKRVDDENELFPTEPEQRRAFRAADFSTMDAMVSW